MNIINKFFVFFVAALLLSINTFNSNDSVDAQDIPELHMLVLQGDIFVSGSKDPNLDGLELTAKIKSQTVGSITIAENTSSSRYVALEIGPNESLEGEDIEFWIGNQKADLTVPFGPTTPSGTYCKGCSWVLPLSITKDLNFTTFPQATPTPVPAVAIPAFLTGNLIFGSVLSAPAELTIIEAYIDGELVGKGSVMGPTFSITVDPGNVNYIGKQVVFKIADVFSKTTYSFQEDDFITDFKLFFPEYVPPTPTPTALPAATPVPLPTSTPEPTRTPTPVPQPTATYTATPTPTPIVLTTSLDNSDSQIILEDSDTGGCNSRGGGAASLSLIVLSAAPLYLSNRRRRKS